MQRLVPVFILLLLLAQEGMAQESVQPPPPTMCMAGFEPFRVVESMPRFPGCADMIGSDTAKQACADERFRAFLAKNLRWPSALQDTGRVLAQFTVRKDGAVADIELLQDFGGGAGQEALRVLRLMTRQNIRWTPGKQRGRPVNVTYRLPIRFARAGTVQASKRKSKKAKERLPETSIIAASPSKNSVIEELMPVPEPLFLKVFPNPARNGVTLTLEGSNKPVIIRLFNMLGQQLLQRQLQTVHGKISIQLPFNFDEEGMLLLQVEQAGKVYTQKLLRQ